MKSHFPKIWLLGASFKTANMGVNALTESSLECISARWPEVEVILRAYTHESAHALPLKEREIYLREVAIRFDKNFFRANNIYKLFAYAFILKLIPFAWLRNQIKKTNSYVKTILETDLVVDITAGDSFSDIYGMSQFSHNALPKWLFILYGRRFILLPQTYGPFKHTLTKKISRYLLNRAEAIYSRDLEGLNYAKKLLGHVAEKKIVKFVPDVAFVLGTERFNSPLITTLEAVKAQGKILVGFNISGLIYNGGQEATAKFQLKGDYPTLVNKLIHTLLAYPDTVIILISHVFDENHKVESDPYACQTVYQQMTARYSDRILLLEETLNHKQVKYLIGHCHFFLGARMHACIAAISQGIPAIGMAYSKKFSGVFESAGVDHMVVELREQDDEAIVEQVKAMFVKREETADRLRTIVPNIQKQVMEFLDEVHI